jgi:hypothetical protein
MLIDHYLGSPLLDIIVAEHLWGNTIIIDHQSIWNEPMLLLLRFYEHDPVIPMTRMTMMRRYAWDRWRTRCWSGREELNSFVRLLCGWEL